MCLGSIDMIQWDEWHLERVQVQDGVADGGANLDKAGVPEEVSRKLFSGCESSRSALE